MLSLFKRSEKGHQVYLSGPMSGYKDFNQPAFAKAAAELRAQGYEVFVPGESEEYDDIERLTWEVGKQKREFYLARDIFWITEMADSVVVLPGWQRSAGAKLEVAVAQAIGVPVFLYPNLTLLDTTVHLTAGDVYDC